MNRYCIALAFYIIHFMAYRAPLWGKMMYGWIITRIAQHFGSMIPSPNILGFEPQTPYPSMGRINKSRLKL